MTRRQVKEIQVWIPSRWDYQRLMMEHTSGYQSLVGIIAEESGEAKTLTQVFKSIYTCLYTCI